MKQQNPKFVSNETGTARTPLAGVNNGLKHGEMPGGRGTSIPGTFTDATNAAGRTGTSTTIGGNSSGTGRAPGEPSKGNNIQRITEPEPQTGCGGNTQNQQGTGNFEAKMTSLNGRGTGSGRTGPAKSTSPKKRGRVTSSNRLRNGAGHAFGANEVINTLSDILDEYQLANLLGFA